MSHPIHATPLSAAYCSRIDLTPSRFAAALWFAWLALVCAVVWFAVDLPWPLRISLCVAMVVPAIRCIGSFVLLRGSRAVRTIEWSENGEFCVRLGPHLAAQPAELAEGSFRLGLQLWVLRFMTPVGLCTVLIAGGVQDAKRYRRLSRCLTAHLRRASGRRGSPAVTIRPKV